ncbi:RhoGAP domain containing protein [Acanthamoeba castellanii str. Neff]|uniref:RhoGAP domain containing protein n=1 Tax=Acanthamoeba castellanii (strain ATCC 30010 / Neff) TaxID=1257118 RepID=L8GLA7_ACACF|nr:RhoGAP domain containing protein [Acanthamoeba castellanii str. Neff]ELR12986.1 RhoGAP domain containing protein [Acanthamoeba castellanii str. Neff]
MVQRGAQLFYFTQPHLKDSAAKGIINLEGAEVSRPDDASAPELSLPNAGNVLFLVKTAKGRIYMLKGEQDKDVEGWIQRLQKATQAKAPVGAGAGAGKEEGKDHTANNADGYSAFYWKREETNLGIPIVVHRILTYLDSVLEVQGIFRLSGGAESVRNLKKAFDTSKDLWNVALPDFTSSGPHAVASLLKLFMKELPEPLVPNDFYKLFLDLQKERCHDATARLRDLRELIFKMPPAHRAMLAELAGLLRRIANMSKVNQMTPKNLAICLAPNIFRSNDLNLLESMTDAPYLLSMMKTFITQHPYLFAEVEDLDAIKPERKSGAIVMIPIAQLAALNNESGSPVPHVACQPTLPPAKTNVPLTHSGDALKLSGGRSESGNSLVLDVEGFMYDEEMMEDSSAEQLTEEELLEAVQVFINDCQVILE